MLWELSNLEAGVKGWCKHRYESLLKDFRHLFELDHNLIYDWRHSKYYGFQFGSNNWDA